MGQFSGTITGHSRDNYIVGKGIVYLKLAGDEDYVDRGNITSCTVTCKPTTLDHYSSRRGTKTKDLSVVTQKDVTVTFTLEEASADNIALHFMGSLANSPPGTARVNIFSESQIIGAFKFVGHNDVGPDWTIELPAVSFTPSKALDFITDGWGSFEITGDVLADDQGVFGTAENAHMESTAVA